MRQRPMRKGFTLIELSLSMVFVGILSLSIALIIRDTIASYRRGLTLNQVNTVGMDIVDDIRAAVQNASSKSVLTDCMKYYYNVNETAFENCKKDQGYNFVYWVKTGEVEVDGMDDVMSDVPLYGAFCTGTYSYIWNSGYFETDNTKINGEIGSTKWAKLRYETADGSVVMVENSTRNTNKPFRLLKVRDDQRGVCAGVERKLDAGGRFATGYSGKSGRLDWVEDFDGVFDMTAYGMVDANEPPVDIIITDKTYDLAIYDLFTARPAISSTQKNMFYSTSFILGTVNGGINILANGKSCAAPSEYSIENYDYCSINKFSFAAQSGVE